ncbi:unnamed protein product [Microthlaspi erraticum]|uniref:F-box domain-containing protein n=1 Tax=Microthlaspi erraticum TaxID=1685480 RepID=A0A6D2ILT0_9BRAS|nr:unnamed protein product [Microthlaspi erraticum]CAA7051798.1 unnamed protein product [Microthlaspi erraticum]
MMNSIPIDLFLDIISRLPAKSVAKCFFVSKQWASMLCRPDFTELFLTRSSACQRLLFAIREVENNEWHFFSSPQPQNPYETSSLVVAADSHIKFPEGMCPEFCDYASGLIYSTGQYECKVEDNVNVICNPSTGQYASLPELGTYRSSKYYLGFDPIDKIFKVLYIGVRIMTLGNGAMRWRKIQCSLTHHNLFSEGICINGVLYYISGQIGVTSYVIVCFDVRSEKFDFIDAEGYYSKLINFKGKFCMVDLSYIRDGGHSRHLELCLSVLEDVEKREWSKHVYTLRDDKFDTDRNGFLRVRVAGVTATGDIVLSSMVYVKTSKRPFYVFYFNPEEKTLDSVEIQGFGDMSNINGDSEVTAFVDHVDDPKVSIMLQHRLKLTCNNYEPTRTQA